MISDYNEEMTIINKYTKEKSKAKIENFDIFLKYYNEINKIEKSEKVRLAKENAKKQKEWVIKRSKKMSQRIEYRHQPELFEERI